MFYQLTLNLLRILLVKYGFAEFEKNHQINWIYSTISISFQTFLTFGLELCS